MVFCKIKNMYYNIFMRLNYYEKCLKNFASEYIDNAGEKNYSYDFVTPFYNIIGEILFHSDKLFRFGDNTSKICFDALKKGKS